MQRVRFARQKRDYDDGMDRIGKFESRELLKPGEVAHLLRVDPKTVTRWAAKGRIRSIRTPGGHRRFYGADVAAMLNGKEPRTE